MTFANDSNVSKSVQSLEGYKMSFHNGLTIAKINREILVSLEFDMNINNVFLSKQKVIRFIEKSMQRHHMCLQPGLCA